MRTITLFLFAALAVTSVDAASYQTYGGPIVDPILDVHGNVLAYSGNNLEPSAQLQHANLSGAHLTDAALSQANLKYANLADAHLGGANLTGVDLSGVQLFYADLTDADLNSANLNGADLTAADLNNANLTAAILSDAILDSAVLSSADLSGSILTDVWNYNDATWTDAFYYTDNEPTWRSGMNAAWRTSVGILALAPTSAVPEPASLLLALFGLALLPRRRRR